MTQHSAAEWHKRYVQQSSWTRDLKRYFFSLIGLEKANRVLEVGCGTGAILMDILDTNPSGLYGLDISLKYLRLAAMNIPACNLTHGDALVLPFKSGSFDVVLCHFFLLWVGKPEKALAEMVRVTRPGGHVMALAEPDYGGRIDYPDPLGKMGKLQARALQKKGADIHLGRKLSGLFYKVGLVDVQAGVLGNFWKEPPSIEDRALEWEVLEDDLSGCKQDMDMSHYTVLDEAAWSDGSRVLFVPTFYAWGKVA
mgnify:FL=1